MKRVLLIFLAISLYPRPPCGRPKPRYRRHGNLPLHGTAMESEAWAPV